ncbi:cysteine dioxygenase [Actinomycetota bacterium]
MSLTTAALRPVLSTAPRPADADPRVEEDRLAEVVRRVAADPQAWRPLVHFDRGERHWARLHHPEVPADVELFVVSWRTFERTDLHSHGGATAAFTVVEGVVHEVRVDPRGRLMPRQFVPGIVATVGPDVIHDVRNERAVPAVTVHAYSPGLTDLRYYSWQDRQVRLERVVRTGHRA